jgi:hypothetical protein
MILNLTDVPTCRQIMRGTFLKVLLLALLVAPGHPQEHSSQQGHEGTPMSMKDSTLQGKLLADKRDSEFKSSDLQAQVLGVLRIVS